SDNGVGARREPLVQYPESHAHLPHAVPLRTQPEWRRGNGISVHAARTALAPDEEELLLSMADHLVAPDALRAMIDAPRGRNHLLVDPRIELVHEIEDATKVWDDAGRITRLAKELTRFNAVDCAIFGLRLR